MNISNLLERNARKYPLKEAIVIGQERVNYQLLNQEVNRLASALRERGVGKGDKVVIFMPNTKEFVISYFATLRLGAVTVPINARLAQPEVAYILEHSDACALLVHEALFASVSGIRKEGVLLVKTGDSDGGWLSFQAMLESGEDAPISCDLHEDDEATILYTSGTTGLPKGVLFTYRNVLSAAVMTCNEMEMKPESRILHLMPLSHSAQLHLFLVAGTYVGATHILSPTFAPDILLRLTESEKATHFFGAPVAYLLTAKAPNIDDFDLSSMKLWVYGGAPLSQPEIKAVKAKFKTDRLFCVYGLTEAGPTGTLLLPEEHDEHAGSIGKRGALGTEVRIVNEEGNDVSVGEVGEIVIFGEGVMKGYYKDEAQTHSAFLNGWLKTGDMARIDEDGYMWVVDRKKDMIISGGVNIFPKEVEEALLTHPLITDVALIGVPHPEWGETVKAYIVASEAMDDLQEECTRFLDGKVASYKVPRIYEQIAELPRNATGKILKQVLRDQNKTEVTQ